VIELRIEISRMMEDDNPSFVPEFKNSRSIERTIRLESKTTFPLFLLFDKSWDVGGPRDGERWGRKRESV